MKSLLVPVEEHTSLGAVLDAALILGRRFGSYIEGVPSSPNVPAFIAAEAAIGDTSFLSPANRQAKAEACRLHFETFMSARGVPPATAASGVCFGWREGDPVEDDAMGSYARIFDMTIVGQPRDELNQPRIQTAEAALSESGRPVLVVPPTALRSLGERVAILWNRSVETARAVAMSMPLLTGAQQVTVIEIEDWGVSGPSGPDLARSLRRHGLAVATRTAPDVHRHPGRSLLEAASALDCDLLIKGAYTQSRLRQMIFGGATSHILESSDLPVLMTH